MDQTKQKTDQDQPEQDLNEEKPVYHDIGQTETDKDSQKEQPESQKDQG